MTTYLKEGRRRPGSEWLKNHPRFLEWFYDVSKQVIVTTYPWLKRINPKFAEKLMIRGEEISKGWMFNCQMCGQCILHSTGMTCPMTCPKNLRNGPCGGVRTNGHCEVIPELPCIWVQAWERSHQMPTYGHEMHWIQPPVNRALQGTSAWINLIEKVDIETPPGWKLAAQASQTEIVGTKR
ncbi:MAG: methylenetetrahydrofolate reductase C-terminal domain-containing protein [Anaerolineales bacterium]|nr:methylenetetrahydrofolate reductase C-terminal domain-containing protein [Anaerolineales bacterium]